MTLDALPKKVREELATLNPDFLECRTTTHEQIDKCLRAFGPEVVEGMHQELGRQITAHKERVKPASARQPADFTE